MQIGTSESCRQGASCPERSGDGQTAVMQMPQVRNCRGARLLRCRRGATRGGCDAIDLREVTVSPVLEYLQRLLDEYRGARRGRGGRPTSPSSAGPIRVVRDLRGDRRRPRLRGRRHRRSSSPSSRSRSRSCSGWRSRTRAATRSSSGWASSRRATRSTRSWSTTATARSTRWSTPGAIVATGLIERTRRDAPRWNGSSRRSRATPAARLDLDETVYRSESITGDRNRAIAHLMRSFGMLARRRRRGRSTRTSGSARCS